MFWPIRTFHWLHSACFNNETFCSDLRCAYVVAHTLPVYTLLPHEITRQRHRRIITYFRSIRSSLFNTFRHGVHLNKIYKSSIPTSQRTQSLSLQRSIGTYCEIHTQHKNKIRGEFLNIRVCGTQNYHLVLMITYGLQVSGMYSKLFQVREVKLLCHEFLYTLQ